MVAIILAMKSLTLSQFLNMKQGLCNLDVEIWMVWIPVNGEGVAIL